MLNENPAGNVIDSGADGLITYKFTVEQDADLEPTRYPKLPAKLTNEDLS